MILPTYRLVLMTWEAWLTVAVACTLLVSLAMRVAATDLLALACLAILVVVQNVSGSTLLPTPEQAVSGFGNKGLITIGLLFAVVAGLEFTGGTELATGWLLNRAKKFDRCADSFADPSRGTQCFPKQHARCCRDDAGRW